MRTRGFLSFLCLSSFPVLFLNSCGGSAWFARENRPPVADAGPDTAVYQGQPFRLDGSRSADPDGMIVSYRWVQNDGRPLGGSGHEGVRADVVAPFVDPPGEELQFRLTVTDDGGLSSSDLVRIKVDKYLFFDDFRSDTTKRYAPSGVGQNGNTGTFRYIEALEKVHATPTDNAGLKFSHDVPVIDNGTFSFVFTPTRVRQQGGLIRVFLKENNESYYELYVGNEQGSGGLRKVVNGVEVESIRLKNGYSMNIAYPTNIVFGPESAVVDANGELAVIEKDHHPIPVGRFEIYTEGQETYFDNIVLTQDPFVKAVKHNRVGLWDSKVSVKAIPGSMRKGWKIRFILDQHTQNQFVKEDTREPFEATFEEVSMSPHTMDAYIIDETGINAIAHDQLRYDAMDGYYVALGDSITKGSSDDSLSAIESGRSGYGPVLENLLESAKGYPHRVVIQGLGGNTSANGLNLMPTTLSIHPSANYFLILFGTNDSAIQVPSGKGLKPGDPGYRDSYKDNVQQIISLIIEAGKTPILAKVPITFSKSGGKRRYRNPDRDPRNVLIREYNRVIDELNTENSIPVSPPDFYSYFREHPKELSDGIHPNGRGYRSMAKLWLLALTRGNREIIATSRDTEAKKEAKKEADPIPLVKSPPAKKSPEIAVPSGTPRGERYMVQVAAFRNPEFAETLRKQLLIDGYKAVIQPTNKYHKVIVGPYPDKSAANQAIRKLKAERKLEPILVRR